MKYFLLLLFFLILLMGCAQPSAPTTPTIPSPESRSYYMGFTPFSYGITTESNVETYSLVTKHGDIISHHFDEGVPWEEAFTNTPFPEKVEGEIAKRKMHTPETMAIFLSTTFLSGDRKARVGYWGEASPEITQKWAAKNWNDPELIQAYVNYAQRMIDEFHPLYYAYAIELDNSLGPAQLTEMVPFIQGVYSSLKISNPNLPVFITFQGINLENDRSEQNEIIQLVLPYTDMIGISLHPFWVYDQTLAKEADPQKVLDDEWLSRFTTYGKPIGITETSWIAEDLSIPTHNIFIKSNPEWQGHYVKMLLEESQKQHAEFVIWWEIRDYDQLWPTLSQYVDEFFILWKDTGLYDGDGNPRVGLSIWDAWKNAPLEKE